MKKINYETIKSISDELPFVLHYVDRRPLNTIGTKTYNWHSNLELIYCAEGVVKTYADEKEYTLNKGDILVVNPDSFHGTFEYHNCVYNVLMIDPSFSHSNGIYPENLRLTEYIRNEKVSELFKNVINAFQDNSQLKTAIIRQSVLTLLIYLYANFTQDTVSKSYSTGKNRIKDVIKYINEHYREKLTIDDISKHIGISKSYLSHEFTKFTGRSIVEHINLTRCQRAQKLIRSGMNVSEAAAESGFENLSYFTRTYKKQLNVLPSEDLKNKQGSHYGS